MRLIVLFMTLCALSTQAPASQPKAAATYTLRFANPQTHYLQVEAKIPTGGAQSLTLLMPVWTPGSYLVREFSRDVQQVRALDDGGRRLPLEKSAKNRWRVTTAGAHTVHLSYRIYARALSARTSYVSADFALLNPPGTFIYPIGARGPFVINLSPPKNWRAYTALERTAPNRYRAPTLDALMDSPIALGTPKVAGFTIDGVEHTLVTFDADARFDPERATQKLAKLVAAHRSFWGELPYDQYLFFNLLVGGRGGLEHAESAVILGDRLLQARTKDEGRWLTLASHEFFHAWNGKRLRPAALGPFDYERENHTESLWIVEGFTDYYDALLARRAGVLNDEQVLGRLSWQIGQLQNTPGRAVRSLALASYDAWIRHYHPDENSVNTDVSYYAKGALVALLLDVEIRRRTAGKKSLDHVMRAAWAQLYARDPTRGYSAEAFNAVISEVAGVDLDPWIREAVESTGELDYKPALAWWGLRFKPEPRAASGSESGPGWLGLTVDAQHLITQVRHDGPAHLADLNVGDEIVAIDDDRLDKPWPHALQRTHPGQKAEILVSRRGRLRRTPVTFAKTPRRWILERNPKASAEQRARFKAWMSGESP